MIVESSRETPNTRRINHRRLEPVGNPARILAFACVLGALSSAPASAQQSEIDTLRKMVEELKKSDAEKLSRISQLESQVQELKNRPAEPPTSNPDDALDKAVRDLGATIDQGSGSALQPKATGGGVLKLIDVSFDSNFLVGSSSATDRSLLTLQGGDHDPSKRGFRVPNSELSLAGAVDPYFTVESHIVFSIDPENGSTNVELEEAFGTTTSLPWGLQVQAGQKLLEFGRVNGQHPHQWEFIDQPLIVSRVFGADGLRSQGARVSWLTPLPWFSEIYLGAYNADGDTLTSFFSTPDAWAEGRASAGRPFVNQDFRSLSDLLYLMHLDNTFDLSEEFTLRVGLSAVHGPNATGPNGDTWIYGADVLLKWRPADNERGWPFVIFQSEVIRRDLNADSYFNIGDPLNPADDVFIPSRDLSDWGLYTQLIWGFTPGWLCGARYEYVSGSGADYDGATNSFVSRSQDPFRDNRYRISGLLSYMPTEFSKFRFQYNYDHADHLADKDAHSIWLGLELLIGAHAAHKY